MIEIQRSRPVSAGVNITPLVDIVFLLLIFFLLTAFFIQPQGVGIKLPQAEGAPVPAGEDITVVVTADGQAYLADEPLSPDQVEDRVRAALAVDPSRPVVIKADQRLVLQKAVAIMERCKQAGADRLIIATQAPLPGH